MATPFFCQQGTLHTFAKGTVTYSKSPARHVDRSRVNHAARLRHGSGALLRGQASPYSKDGPAAGPPPTATLVGMHHLQLPAVTDRAQLGARFIATHLSPLLQMTPVSLRHSSNRLVARAWSPGMHTCRQLLSLSGVPLAAVRLLALRRLRCHPCPSLGPMLPKYLLCACCLLVGGLFFMLCLCSRNLLLSSALHPACCSPDQVGDANATRPEAPPSMLL